MNVEGKHYRTIWMEGITVCMIDQTRLPFAFHIYRASDYVATCDAIRHMVVRGAGAIGAAAGYAMAQAAMQGNIDLAEAYSHILSTRPTASNLKLHLDSVFEAAQLSALHAMEVAEAMASRNAEDGQMIGQHGKHLIEEGMGILTHCNAGWLGFVDYGSALSPIYAAHHQGIRFMVYADETRPRGQGARITAWELAQEGVACTVIPDNAAAWLMAEGKIDRVIVGADRIAANGDTANKIGTLEKAIAAAYYGIPFYVAAPTSTIDLQTASGQDIPIEHRTAEEVLFQEGIDLEGNIHKVLVCTPGAAVINPAFDVTPAHLITAIITEKGMINANEEDIRKLFQEESSAEN